jgi:hypothetical protein
MSKIKKLISHRELRKNKNLFDEFISFRRSLKRVKSRQIKTTHKKKTKAFPRHILREREETLDFHSPPTRRSFHSVTSRATGT